MDFEVKYSKHDSNAVETICVSDADLAIAFTTWQRAQAGSVGESTAWEIVLVMAENVLYLQSGIKALILDVLVLDSPQKFTLSIKLGNDAMQDHNDIGSALVQLGQRLMKEHARGLGPSTVDSGIIRDINGNNVGSWGVR